MSPMIPDCGVLTTPRRSPPVKLSLSEKFTSPKLASLPYKAPYSSEAANVTLGTGFSFGFYKSAKSPVTPVRRVSDPDPRRRYSSKKRNDGFNKGVGHNIKKPKTKSKELKKKTRSMKTMMKKLKDGNFTPSHWTPANRSPVKKTPNTSGKKKRHVLASPGMSFLDEASQDEADDAGGKKFFTSRSRAAATVNISKNVMLAAKNGDISLKQRGVLFEKKNVGRVIEEELDKFIQTSSVTESLPSSSLPSVKANPRPMPTRVPTTPSPPKRMASPKKGKKLFNPRSLTLPSKGPSELQDLENTVDNGIVLRKSPRKQDVTFSPRKSPDKGDRFSSPVRRSPRHFRSPSRTPNKTPLAKTDRGTPKKISAKRCSTELNFTASEVSEHSPKKRSSDENNSEENLNKDILSKDNLTEDSELDGPENNNTTRKSSNSPKLYPMFDSQNWRPAVSSPKKKKSCQKHLHLHKSDGSQMIIDAGQKEYGTRQCSDCGVLYEIANQEDEASHLTHHNATHSSLKFNGWKNENLVRQLDELGGRVVMVSSRDPPHFWRKVEEVLTVVDNELGFSEGTNLVRESSRAFIYILDRKIVGFLIGERIEKANRVIPSKATTVSTNRLLCCSQNQFKVWAGVSRLWVLDGHRGKGIAGKLCEALLCNMFSHHILNRDEIAFSDPTESGTKFAEKFTGKRDFLVYRR